MSFDTIRSAGTKTQSSSTVSVPPRRVRLDVVVVRDVEWAAALRGALSGGSGRHPTNCLERRHSTQAGAQSLPATQTQPWFGSSYHRP